MLQRRGQVFASRIVIPSVLQPLLRRVEITRSLRTTDAREARRRLGLWETHIGSLFAIVRKRGPVMTSEQLDALTRRYLRATFDEIEDRLALEWSAGGLDEWGSQLNERCHELSAALAHGDLSGTLRDAQQMAPQADDRAQRKLARRMLEARLQAGVAELNALGGNPLVRPQEITQRQERAAPAESPPSPLLSQVAAMYAEERIARSAWSAKTALQNQKIFEVIISLLGDQPIAGVTKDDMRRLGLDLPRLPANLTKKFRGASPKEALERARDSADVARLEPRSVNKYLQQARSLFAWAEEHDHLAKSPASVLRDVQEGRAQDARKEFTDDDISALFAYIDKLSPEPYGWWVPLIMAYTGCRMGEAAQLRKSDVRQEQDVWVFDINEEAEEKTLKTDAAQRLVPVHPRLIELGLLKFVEGCSDGFLFPERVRFTRNEARGNVDALSKQLNRWLDNSGVTDKRKTFQSFRATFITRLKGVQVPDYQIAEIVGHENSNITSGRYGKRTQLQTLADLVRRVSLPV
ncbi:tyrosine-type recombinase/integrase [Novilysobacter erysipheiresistens]|uniref:Tyrosine-type recombinase/integrase n=1 Tax=Novilysobacter erysipheiresistens TaxID=1749332 RepID=A0ABU7YZV8_9GAMM